MCLEYHICIYEIKKFKIHILALNAQYEQNCLYRLLFLSVQYISISRPEHLSLYHLGVTLKQDHEWNFHVVETRVALVFGVLILPSV